MRFASLWVLLLAGCAEPGDVVFTASEGAGLGIGDCGCAYDDGSHGDLFLQFTCTRANQTLGSVSFFLDPSQVGESQGMTFIFEPDTVPGSFRGGGTGKFTSFGKATRAKPGQPTIIHSIEGVEVRWTAQDACDAASGCGNRYHLEPGALAGGTGTCYDNWATIDQY